MTQAPKSPLEALIEKHAEYVMEVHQHPYLPHYRYYAFNSEVTPKLIAALKIAREALKVSCKNRECFKINNQGFCSACEALKKMDEVCK